MNISPLHRVLVLLFVLLGLYYSAIFNPVNLIDDSQILRLFEWDGSGGLRSFLLPGESFYYRPFLMFTFYLDFVLWNNQPSFLHLENILLHAGNALLVYSLARKVFDAKLSHNTYLPLLASLLFATHPINTESVNWIAGRSDLLATFFVLSAFNLLWSGLQANRKILVFLSSFAFMAGVLTKEVMLFAFPVFAAMILLKTLPGLPIRSKEVKWRQTLLFSWPFLLGGLLVAVRMAISGVGTSVIAKALENYRYDLLDTIRVFAKVWGFYIKKLFLPLPLNFGILSVADSYLWLGLAFFITCCVLLRRDSLPQRCFLVATYLIAPALIIAVADVTWTPIGERYLYLASVFFAIACAGFIRWLIVNLKRPRLGWSVVLLVLVFYGTATASRNLVWQSNKRLYEDTLDKSPKFVRLQNELAIINGEAGNYEQAIEHLTNLDRRGGLDSYLYYVNKASFLMQQEKLSEARELITSISADKKVINVEILKVLASIDEKRLYGDAGEFEKNEIVKGLSETYQIVYRKSGDSAALYRAGQLELSLGNVSVAQKLFSQTYQRSPEDAYYREAAQKLATRLSGESSK